MNGISPLNLIKLSGLTNRFANSIQTKQKIVNPFRPVQGRIGPSFAAPISFLGVLFRELSLFTGWGGLVGAIRGTGQNLSAAFEGQKQVPCWH